MKEKVVARKRRSFSEPGSRWRNCCEERWVGDQRNPNRTTPDRMLRQNWEVLYAVNGGPGASNFRFHCEAERREPNATDFRVQIEAERREPSGKCRKFWRSSPDGLRRSA